MLCSHISKRALVPILPPIVSQVADMFGIAQTPFIDNEGTQTPFLSATTFKYPCLVSIAKSIICIRPLFAL